MAESTRKQIDEFLAQKRIAVVGVSRSGTGYSNNVFRDMKAKGYDVVPVNPKSNEVEGQACFANVREITPPVQAALVMTTPSVSAQVVRECREAGIKHIWVGMGSTSKATADAIAQAGGSQVISGYCPYMFLPGSAFFHRAHGFVARVIGQYPK